MQAPYAVAPAPVVVQVPPPAGGPVTKYPLLLPIVSFSFLLFLCSSFSSSFPSSFDVL